MEVCICNMEGKWQSKGHFSGKSIGRPDCSLRPTYTDDNGDCEYETDTMIGYPADDKDEPNMFLRDDRIGLGFIFKEKEIF